MSPQMDGHFSPVTIVAEVGFALSRRTQVQIGRDHLLHVMDERAGIHGSPHHQDPTVVPGQQTNWTALRARRLVEMMIAEDLARQLPEASDRMGRVKAD